MPKLRLISQTGKISNHLVLADCTKHGVAVAEGVGSPVAPAELCWALIMAASRHLVPYCSALKAGCWQDSGRLGLGRTLDGLMLGIWGYGRIGRRIAAYGKAFGMRVLVWGSAASREQARQDAFALAAADPQLAQAENKPLWPALRRMFGEKLALIDAISRHQPDF